MGGEETRTLFNQPEQDWSNVFVSMFFNKVVVYGFQKCIKPDL